MEMFIPRRYLAYYGLVLVLACDVAMLGHDKLHDLDSTSLLTFDY